MRLQKRFGALLFALIFLGLLVACRSQQQYIETPDHRLQWWLADINWSENRFPYTGRGVRIAVLDSGIDSAHPDLRGRIESEIRVPGLEETLEETDNRMHGTAVAGIIIAYPNNERGVLGIAPDATIISIVITDDPDGIIEIHNLIDGIYLAIEEEVDIINISAGVREASDDLTEAIQKAYDAGIIIVAAAGNFMDGEILYPARKDIVLAVGARSRRGEIISPRNYSDVIFLPGENIVTTVLDNGYTGLHGTSIATPILTGTIALILEANRNISSEQIYRYFLAKGEDYRLDVRRNIFLK